MIAYPKFNYLNINFLVPVKIIIALRNFFHTGSDRKSYASKFRLSPRLFSVSAI